jgi:hypothetical protein
LEHNIEKVPQISRIHPVYKIPASIYIDNMSEAKSCNSAVLDTCLGAVFTKVKKIQINLALSQGYTNQVSKQIICTFFKRMIS